MQIQFNSSSTASCMQQAMEAKMEACPTKQVALKALKTLACVLAGAGLVSGVAAAAVFTAGAAPIVAIVLGGTAAIAVAIAAITAVGVAIAGRFGATSPAKKAQVAPSKPQSQATKTPEAPPKTPTTKPTTKPTKTAPKDPTPPPQLPNGLGAELQKRVQAMSFESTLKGASDMDAFCRLLENTGVDTVKGHIASSKGVQTQINKATLRVKTAEQVQILKTFNADFNFMSEDPLDSGLDKDLWNLYKKKKQKHNAMSIAVLRTDKELIKALKSVGAKIPQNLTVLELLEHWGKDNNRKMHGKALGFKDNEIPFDGLNISKRLKKELDELIK